MPKPSVSYLGVVFIWWICEAKSGLCVELPDILAKVRLSLIVSVTAERRFTGLARRVSAADE
jgi:hypothetical protein